MIFQVMLLHWVLWTPIGEMADPPSRTLPPVKVFTQQDYEQPNYWSQKSTNDPDWKFKLKVVLRNRRHAAFSIKNSLSKDKPAPDANDALALIDMLYEDTGDPAINGLFAHTVLGQIRRLAKLPELDDEVANIFRQGLVEYMDTGGGRDHPASEGALAYALAEVGGPAYPEINNRVLEMIAYARKHNNDLQSDAGGNLLELGIARTHDVLARKAHSQKELDKARGEADRALILLSESKELSLADITRAALLATVDFGDAATNEDMIARLLIAYRLRLENRKGLKRPVIAAIDKRLLWLAEKKTRKLTSKRHWSLWPKAVGAIPRQTVSHELHGFLRKSEKAKEDRSLAKAAADAQGRLRRQ